MEKITQKVIPFGDFGIKYPLNKNDNFVLITKEELIKLCNHDLKWEKRADGYILIPHDGSEFKRKRENSNRIAELKKLLAESDYKAIKYAEGLISEGEYTIIKAQRQAWRDEINAIEGMLK